MKKFALRLFVSLMAVIFIFGSFEVCNAANLGGVARVFRGLLSSSRTIRGIKAIDKAGDAYDVAKVAATLMVADTSELTVHGVELGKTSIAAIDKQWQREGPPEVNDLQLKCFYYGNRTVVVMTDLSLIAKVIACEGNEYIKTKRGIHCGSSLQDVINAYGSNYEIINNGDYNIYLFSFEIEENILDRAYNFFNNKEGRIGKIIFFVNKYNNLVVGLCAALVGEAEFDG